MHILYIDLIIFWLFLMILYDNLRGGFRKSHRSVIILLKCSSSNYVIIGLDWAGCSNYARILIPDVFLDVLMFLQLNNLLDTFRVLSSWESLVFFLINILYFFILGIDISLIDWIDRCVLIQLTWLVPEMEVLIFYGLV